MSGQADTGELRIWFLVPDADSLEGALKKMTATISKVFRAADIVAQPARKRTPLRFPRNNGKTVISSYKIVNEVLAAERANKEAAVRDDMMRVAHRVGASIRQIAEVSGLNRKTVSNFVGFDKQDS